MFIRLGNDCRPQSATVCDGLWHHVAIVYSSNTITIFLDGAYVGSCLLVSPLVLPAAQNAMVYIGW